MKANRTSKRSDPTLDAMALTEALDDIRRSESLQVVLLEFVVDVASGSPLTKSKKVKRTVRRDAQLVLDIYGNMDERRVERVARALTARRLAIEAKDGAALA